MTRLKLMTIAFLAAGLFGCERPTDSIKIGVAGPMTGSEAVFGEQLRRGAEKAVADINATGGLLGRKVELVVADDACDPRQAVSVANDLSAKGVVFVAGHYCSGSSIPASEVYAEAGIVQISPASTNPLLTERNLASVFRVSGRDDAQGPVAASFIAMRFDGKRIAVVDDKSSYGQGLAEQFRGALHRKGITEVFYDSINPGDKDFGSLVSRLKQARVDILYFGGYKTEAGLIVRQMRDQALAAILVGGDSLATEEFWSITGPTGNGTLMTFGPDPRLIPTSAKLVDSFRAQHYEPEAYTLYTYAAIQVWAKAVVRAGSVESTAVENALHTTAFNTVIGPIAFDRKGDIKSAGYVMYVWKDGKYVYAE